MLLRAESQGSDCCETTDSASAGQEKSRGQVCLNRPMSRISY